MRTRDALFLLVISGAACAADLDTAALDELAAQQKYKAVDVILGQLPESDPQVIACACRPPQVSKLSIHCKVRAELTKNFERTNE